MQILPKKALWLAALFALTCGAASAQSPAGQVSHTVQPGETLYRISRQYGVTVEQIVRLNPGLQGTAVKSGQTLLIPIVPTAADSTATAATTTYKVKRKDTIWHIAQTHGITVEALVLANPEMSAPGYQLKRGSIIRIPAAGTSTTTGKTSTTIEKTNAATGKTNAATGKTNAATGTAGTTLVGTASAPQPAARPAGPVKVAVMLPFVGNSGIKERCLEYYRGFLMAVDSLKRQGQSVEVYAFDTPADATLAATLAQVKAAGVDAIIGPFYGAHIEEACRFGRQNGVRVFIPFTSKVSDVYTNPYVYLLNAPDAEKQEAVYDLYNLAFSGKTRLVVLRTAAGNEAQFAGYMQQQVKAQGGSATAVSATATDAELRAALAPDAPNVLLPDASDQATLDALLPRLLAFTAAHPQYKVSLMGYPDWQAYVVAHQEHFFALDTYIFTNFYYDNYSPAVHHFERNYAQWFHTELMPLYPRMAMLGFDNGLHLMRGIARYGSTFATQAIPAQPYQSAMHFERVSPAGGVVNNSIWFIHYNRNRSIDKLSVQ